MAFGESAGILFRIRADGSQAKSEINSVQGAIQGSAAGIGSSLTSMVNPATLAAAGIAAIGTAAITAAVALFKFTSEAAEFGSKLYDASVQTGLSAKSISALKIAADSSGSSLEAVSGAVSKLNVLVGQAANGNEKAANTLKQYGITAKDTNDAFNQAVEVIGKMTDQGQKAAAMQALFKDRTGALGTVIDQVNGDFQEYIKTAERLGVVLSEEDLRAADEFGDTLDVLGTQAKIAGVKFASELMPMITRAMSAISEVMAENQGMAREWGNTLVNVATGVGSTFADVGEGIVAHLESASGSMMSNADKSNIWANEVVQNVNRVFQALATLGTSELFRYFSGVGADRRAAQRPGQQAEGLATAEARATAEAEEGARGGGTFPISSGGGGGRGRGGGGRPKKDNAEAEAKRQAAEAERQRKDAVQAAEREMRDTLAVYRAGYENRTALLDFALAAGFVKEKEHIRDVGRIRLEALQDEKRLNEKLLQNENLNAEERKKILNDLKVLDIEISTLKIKNSQAVNEAIAKQTKAENDLAEAERKRANQKRTDMENSLLQERIARINKLEQERNETMSMGSTGGVATQALLKDFAGDQVAIASIEALRSAFEGLGQAIGAVVQAWILYGSAGQSVRQVTAQILAGVAAQAAVKAVFELAEGFAALAMAFFGIPNAGPSAAMHFQAAAMYGVIAGVAAVAGRGVAGNSFKKAGGGGGGAGGGQEGQGNAPGLNFTERFAGFQQQQNQQMAQMQDRTNAVLGGVIDAVTKFNNKFGVTTPDAVVMAGAGGATEAVFNAVQDHMTTDMRGSTNLDRVGGKYR